MLSLSGKRWLLPDQKTPLNASHVLARILAVRGIDPKEKPTLTPPSVFHDMNLAVERIEKAVADRETIGIFGDYDCDGITAVCQLVRYFKRHGVSPWVRLPHRVRDGYGMSKEIVGEVLGAKVSLLITADTGIASVDEISTLKEKSVDTIVTDHHHVHEEIPPAYATIHPHFSTHPLPHPSGSGVVFSLISALEDMQWDSMEEDLALAMFGTVADLVELKGGNRALVQLGLSALNRLPRGPIAELRERCRSGEGALSASDIAYRIAPRINAAGRMEEPGTALTALLEGGERLAQLDALNDERRILLRHCMEDVLHTWDTANLPPFLIAASGDYPHGVIGLIAGKLTERYGRPSCIAFTDGRTCTASLRSPSSYNIVEALGRHSDLLLSYGGHREAAGCTFRCSDLETLAERLQEDVASHTDQDTLAPTLDLVGEIDARDITLDFCRALQSLEPFGKGNAEPLFLLKNVQLKNVRHCGSEKSHLQCEIAGMKAIGFGLAHLTDTDGAFDVVCKAGIDHWNGGNHPQIIIQDLALVTKKAPTRALF